MARKQKHHRGGGGHRAVRAPKGGPTAIGHEMTAQQEMEDRMANRASNSAATSPPPSPFGGGGPMAGPAPAGMGAGGPGLPPGPQQEPPDSMPGMNE